MKEIGKIMGSEARVKIMRLFLFHEHEPFDVDAIAKRCRVAKPTTRKEVNMLHKTRFLSKKTFTKEVSSRGDKVKKKKVSGWILNKKFPLVRSFKKLLLDPDFIPTEELPQRFKGSGHIKMIVLSGLFMNDHDRKLDLLLVGNRMDKNKVDRAVKVLESELGKELRYALFDEEEFKYRLDMYDKLLRDVFDYSHEKLVDKIKLSTTIPSKR